LVVFTWRRNSSEPSISASMSRNDSAEEENSCEDQTTSRSRRMNN
jgi:hypothetical protein